VDYCNRISGADLRLGAEALIREAERPKYLTDHTKSGFYDDGRFPILLDVVNHYDSCRSLALTDHDKADLVQFLKSLPRTKGGKTP